MDPIARMEMTLVEAGVLSDEEIKAMRTDVRKEGRRGGAVGSPARPTPTPRRPRATSTSRATSASNTKRDGRPAPPAVMVDAINHALAEEMKRDERVLVYGEDVRGREGRRLYGDAEPHPAVRESPLLQRPLGRGLHRRDGGGASGLGLQARRRDPVRRLHLAGHAAAPEPGGPVPLPLQRPVELPHDDPRAGRRLHPRGPLPQPEHRGPLRPHARLQDRPPLQCRRRQRAAQDGDPP